MRILFFVLVLASTSLVFSCNENTTNSKKTNDSTYSGLEGSREQASQLSNATIDTSGGQSGKKTSTDSSIIKNDTPSIK